MFCLKEIIVKMSAFIEVVHLNNIHFKMIPKEHISNMTDDRGVLEFI